MNFPQFLLLFILGIIFRDALAFEVVRESEIDSLIFSVDNKTTGNKPKKQLNCVGDQELCDNYGLNTFKCINEFKKIGRSYWACETGNIEFENNDWVFQKWQSAFPSFIKRNKYDQKIICEKPDQFEYDDEVIVGSCRMEYSLKLDTIKLSQLNGSFSTQKMTIGFEMKSRVQMICKDDPRERMCQRYSISSASCFFDGHHKPNCSSELPSQIKVDWSLDCERPKFPKSDNEIINGTCQYSYKMNWNYVKESSVKHLNFKKNVFTVGKSPQKQIDCLGNKKVCDQYAPSDVVCNNNVREYEDSDWSCDVMVPSFIELNDKKVVCEEKSDTSGFGRDPEIIDGSCQIRLTLKFRSFSPSGYKFEFSPGKKTIGFEEPKDQLSCVDKDYKLCKDFAKQSVFCSSDGKDGDGNFKWSCTDLNKNVQVDSVEIACEKSPENKYYFIVGSCSLKYSLKYKTTTLNRYKKFVFRTLEHTVGNEGPFDQLTCSEPADLCSKYSFERLECFVESVSPIQWQCAIIPDYERENSIVEINTHDVICEKPKNIKLDNEVIDNSCRLIYTLKIKTIRLSDIKSLEFNTDKITKNFRKKPVDQLQCIGELCKHNYIYLVTCDNNGFNPVINNTDWKCYPFHLNYNYCFNSTEITCEEIKEKKFNDTIVLGSCALVYSLTRRAQEPREIEGFSVSAVLLTALCIIIFLIFAALVSNRLCEESNASSDTSAIVNRPNTNVFTIPVQTNSVAIDLPPSYKSVTAMMSQNDETIKMTGTAGTSFR